MKIESVEKFIKETSSIDYDDYIANIADNL